MLIFKEKTRVKSRTVVNETVLTGESLYILLFFSFLDEEVLVDDFDGQCCRTYPDNHSKIIKWRAQRIEKMAKQVKNINYSIHENFAKL